MMNFILTLFIFHACYHAILATCLKKNQITPVVYQPITIVSDGTHDLNTILKTLSKIEKDNNDGILYVRMAIQNVYYTYKSYEQLPDNSHLTIFFLKDWTTYSNEVITGFVRVSSEYLTDYLYFKNVNTTKALTSEEFKKLEFSSYNYHHKKYVKIGKNDTHILFTDKHVVESNHSVMHIDNQTIQDYRLKTNLNYAITLKMKTLENFGKLVNPKFSLYGTDGCLLAYPNCTKSESKYSSSFSFQSAGLRIHTCDIINPYVNTMCLSDLTITDTCSDYMLLYQSRTNKFTIAQIPRTSNDNTMTASFNKRHFPIPHFNFNFLIFYECEGDSCDDKLFRDQIVTAFRHVSGYLKNANIAIKISPKLTYSTNMIIRYKPNLRPNILGTVVSGDIYNNDQIVIEILSTNKENSMHVLIHELIAHVFDVGHQNGNNETEISSPHFIKTTSHKDVYLFSKPSILFLAESFTRSCPSGQKSASINNMNGIRMERCGSTYSLIRTYENAISMNVRVDTVEKWDKISNNSHVKIFDTHYDAVASTTKYVTDRKVMMTFHKSLNDYVCGVYNSICISVAQVQYLGQIKYVNLGDISGLYFTESNVGMCCVNGIRCDSLSNNYGRIAGLF